MKRMIQEVGPHAYLYRDPRTGLAWVEDGCTGAGHSAHPNISRSGSVRGMKDQGYWGKHDKCVRSHGWIYNISSLVVSDDYDEIARQYCECGGVHERRQKGVENGIEN